MTIQVVHLSGLPETRGGQLGEACREKIGAASEFYAGIFQLSEAELKAKGNHFAAIIRDFRPEFATEIQACAHTADIPDYRLFAMNARSELMTALPIGECTSVAFRPTAVLGQTWDWADTLLDLFIVVRHETPEGRRFVSVTEPGILAKIGVSAAGLGVCLNFLMSPTRYASGVPIHVLLRAALECDHWEDIVRLADRDAHGAVGNILAASANGDILNIEGRPEGAHVEAPAGDIFAHTNHYLRGEEGATAELFANSTDRLAATQAFAPQAGYSIDDLKRLLSNTERGPILRPFGMTSGLRVGTVCTVAMDLRERALHVRKGPTSDAPFEVHRV